VNLSPVSLPLLPGRIDLKSKNTIVEINKKGTGRDARPTVKIYVKMDKLANRALLSSIAH